MAATDAVPSTDRIDATSLGGIVIVLTSGLLSIASYGSLGATVRIRWTVGPSYHYGPERASAMLVLVGFPVVLAGLALAAMWLRTRLQRSAQLEAFADVRIVYDGCVLLTLGAVLAGQLVLVVLNL